MDLNRDGNVSWLEAFFIWDLMEREIIINSEPCIEYSDSKSGVPLFFECSGKITKTNNKNNQSN
ncbi:hypothetical protein NBRC116493_32690 [Aurantivibrio infirmus]